MDKLIIFDTTLRDGEQAPGASLTMKEKLEIGRQLVHLGVDVIEAGFPIFSNKLLKEADEHEIEKVGRSLREMMPWMKKQI